MTETSRDREDRRSSRWATFALGALAAVAGRGLLTRAILLKLRHDLRALNAGDYRPLLAGYADDAVLSFNEGAHRWAGEHRGKAAIERFFQDFVAAGLKGEITELFFAGPIWRLTLMIRFDDHAHGPDGAELYRNRTALIAYTRWGKIVRQQDFYEDTERIGVLDARLTELGVMPAAA
ncbi:MAG TPA: nuclear transport factor 2 family protein [Solirubrobacteraceae bacterium]|nr:nuclear transport factor 2 family protein [Solirubrobacteraceae bacterium]